MVSLIKEKFNHINTSKSYFLLNILVHSVSATILIFSFSLSLPISFILMHSWIFLCTYVLALVFFFFFFSYEFEFKWLQICFLIINNAIDGIMQQQQQQQKGLWEWAAYFICAHNFVCFCCSNSSSKIYKYIMKWNKQQAKYFLFFPFFLFTPLKFIDFEIQSNCRAKTKMLKKIFILRKWRTSNNRLFIKLVFRVNRPQACSL